MTAPTSLTDLAARIGAVGAAFTKVLIEPLRCRRERREQAAHGILAALRELPEGYWQRIDGLRCECACIELDDGTFNAALALLLSQRKIERTLSADIRPLWRFRALASAGTDADA